ncbi:hypothetical protein P3T76_016011 [Phytophthora citrophthora]|uniref:Uncharacterized protein n=1 Tax=Phytophthora citrophthora TaxID=4793 RepID=A0AAD9FY98_9STRA|nr:hypothetical protein P3T76_016011 [Phytophthora citrophthora]
MIVRTGLGLWLNHRLKLSATHNAHAKYVVQMKASRTPNINAAAMTPGVPYVSVVYISNIEWSAMLRWMENSRSTKV